MCDDLTQEAVPAQHCHLDKAVASAEDLEVVAEAGPFVAVLKPRGLQVEASCHDTDCVASRLAQKYGGVWSGLKRSWLPKKMHGVVCCARLSEVSIADEAMCDAPLELWFDVIVYAEGTAAALEEQPLPLLAIGSEATLCALEEVGRLAHMLAKVVVANSATGSAEVADALTEAFTSAGCPIIGTLKGCRRLKRRGLSGLQNFKVLLLSRVVCGKLDSTQVPPNHCLKRVLEEEHTFVAEEEQHAHHMSDLIDLLKGPKAASYDEYAPELQRLRMSRLGMTSEAARNALDVLGLLAPSDTEWAGHAISLLEKQLLQQWWTEPRDRQKLQYGMQTTKLLCCCVRVQRDGCLPMEILRQGACIEPDKPSSDASMPLRSTELSEIDRTNHCELLALNEAFALCTEHSLTGEGCAVDVMVAHQPCISCTAAMRNFAIRLPHVQLRIGFCDWRTMQQALNVALKREENNKAILKCTRRCGLWVVECVATAPKSCGRWHRRRHHSSRIAGSGISMHVA
eukprot:gnl/TRDRNA2_/TRDRNA2_133531_c0_seq1.p1 gnl/TRDRNA2_/TRDRNA2_133531_c0~~gnl/TRDRNA2_/TRDRNA2_133531_c0_seq1.p1  ORF type:complete len:512 (-),score=79.89 gnl/TRDRNA2_/TRDRNA2_133531_c0_seq1:511-2046(-)